MRRRQSVPAGSTPQGRPRATDGAANAHTWMLQRDDICASVSASFHHDVAALVRFSNSSLAPDALRSQTHACSAVSCELADMSAAML